MTTIEDDSDEFSGKRALVTGGTKGMGEAIVRQLRRLFSLDVVNMHRFR